MVECFQILMSIMFRTALSKLQAKFKPEVQTESLEEAKRYFSMRAEEATAQGREVTWAAIGENYDLRSFLSREDGYRFREPPI
ncbi:hypothetical protein HJC03_06120 [Rhizobium sp. NLR4b]|uniref:hypothetical protein n=1 Tax=Rhizobium sp. NLR4b TaxID=2731118 RepID=UPI001C83D2C5|nr:hypothetical protein [Rhizobium sp. NLR4b]MBX5249977.1 hypothetical protein [Rhizobium sp. NLR4b]